MRPAVVAASSSDDEPRVRPVGGHPSNRRHTHRMNDALSAALRGRLGILVASPCYTRATPGRRATDPMIIDDETFTQIALHIRRASDGLLGAARQMAVLCDPENEHELRRDGLTDAVESLVSMCSKGFSAPCGKRIATRPSCRPDLLRRGFRASVSRLTSPNSDTSRDPHRGSYRLHTSRCTRSRTKRSSASR